MVESYVPSPCIRQFTIDSVDHRSQEHTGLQANVEEHGRPILVYRRVKHFGETDGCGRRRQGLRGVSSDADDEKKLTCKLSVVKVFSWSSEII